MKGITKICRCIVMLLLLVLIVNIVPVFAEETGENLTSSTQIESGNVSQMIADRINTMVRESGESLTVISIKNLLDFAGNTYYLVEFSPTGYLICNGNYGNIVEYSAYAPSPYTGYDDNLLYCGPSYFYHVTKEGISHTCAEETIHFDDTAVLEKLATFSNEMNLIQAETAAFIVDSDTMLVESDDFATIIGVTPTLEPNATPTGTITYVRNNSAGEKIKNLTTASQIGYNSEGVCGYIASGLLLYWIDECAGSDLFVNDFAFVRSDHNGFIDDSLTRLLRSYGRSNSSDAGGYLSQSIQSVISQYASQHNLSITTHAVILGTNGGVLEALQENNLPIIVFGNLINEERDSKGNHAVFAYGYTSEGQVIVHYGWSNSSEVVLDHAWLTLGSRLELKGYSSNTVPMSDVTTSNWAFNAAQYCARYNIVSTEYGKFNPNGVMTRGAFVYALYTLVGSPDTSNITMPTKYTDVSASSPYYAAAKWAVSQKILQGDTETTLSLNKSLTREQAVTFLYRYSVAMSFRFANTSGPELTSFNDVSSISPYAKRTMEWAVKRYLITGDNGAICPQRTLTRAETAQMIYNLVKRAER